MDIPEFVLASASPARRRLLQTVGIEPTIAPSNFDELQIKLTDPSQLVETLALNKAKTVSHQFPSSLVMGCDSVLFINGNIYGKPRDEAQACNRWQEMQGKIGDLFTGHALIDNSQNRSLVKCQVTKVHFASMDLDAIEAYVATGEPLKCAGSFALEGKGGLFVERIEGCHSNIIGLSLPLLRQMITELGYQISYFWR